MLCMLHLVVHEVVVQSDCSIPFREILPSVFRLSGPDHSDFSSNGTAWVVHPSGIAITCNHVVDSTMNSTRQPNGRLISFDGNEHSYQVIGCSPQHDVAFLKVSGGNSYRAIPIAQHILEQGEQVGGVWNFENMALVCTQGIYSARIPMHTDTFVNPNALIFDMLHRKGGSGGPIVSVKGDAVAMTAGQENGLSIGYSSTDICLHIRMLPIYAQYVV